MYNKTLVSHNYQFVSSKSDPANCFALKPFDLTIRQQPIQARQSTTNERDRRPLDPPPVVQILLGNLDSQENQNFLQDPYLIMSVTLVSPDRHEFLEDSVQNMLSGQTFSSMYKLKDINNQDGGFFVFGDLSIKQEGCFRLKFSIFEISDYGATNLRSIYSKVFKVYSAKSFPGMLESTFLSRSFSDQGVRIRIRKEHRIQTNSSRKRKLLSREDSMPMKRVFAHQYHLPVPSPSTGSPMPIAQSKCTYLPMSEANNNSISNGQPLLSRCLYKQMPYPFDVRIACDHDRFFSCCVSHCNSIQPLVKDSSYHQALPLRIQPNHISSIPFTQPQQHKAFSNTMVSVNRQHQLGKLKPAIVLPTPSFLLTRREAKEDVRLPPIKSLMAEDSGAVDAAVAMVQLAFRERTHV